jgi:thymidylate synthase
VEFETFHAAYLTSLRLLMTGPVYRNAPRGFPSVERLGVRYRVRDASQRIPMVPARRLNIVFNFAEALWYLSGRDDLDFIAYYAPRIRKYSVDGRRLTGTAYGRAIFGTGERPDQWRSVVTELRNDPDSKRAVLQIFRGEELTVPGNPDVSCTLALQFLSREGALHAVGLMRANDAYRGMSSDVFSFTLLQELLARQLGLRLGGYTHLVGSLHVYASDERRVAEVLADPAAAVALPELRFPAMPDGDNWPYVAEVLRQEEPLRLNRHRLGPDPAAIGLPEYWTQVLLLLDLHRSYRYGEALADWVLDALSPLNRWLVGNWRPELAGAVRVGR